MSQFSPTAPRGLSWMVRRLMMGICLSFLVLQGAVYSVQAQPETAPTRVTTHRFFTGGPDGVDNDDDGDIDEVTEARICVQGRFNLIFQTSLRIC